MPLHHLKLIGELPGKERLILAQFTSSFSSKKFGKLWIFDSAISRLVALSRKTDDFEIDSNVMSQLQSTEVQDTRLYELIMATAMCMVIGEWQKCLTLWFIIMLIAESGRGANMAGAGGGGC
jgi:hypothetical protein